MNSDKIKVLFVCLGNICRSPMAEGLFNHHVKLVGLEERFSVDSAGTSPYHVGNLADERMRGVAQSRGVSLTSKSRQIQKTDLDDFDYILAMDKQNYSDIDSLRSGLKANVYLMRDFDIEKDTDDVPDPYFGGIDGFEDVYQILNRSTKALLDHVVKHES